MEIRRDVFQAIADPTRREIIGLLAKQTLPVNAIADSFDVSRQAISLHLKILSECGLLVIKQQGRERYCEAKFKKLHEVSDMGGAIPFLLGKADGQDGISRGRTQGDGQKRHA